MNVLFMTGSHPRHAYMARCIEASGFLSALVIEEREAHIPSPDTKLDNNLKKLFINHFRKRFDAENHFFGDYLLPNINTLNVNRNSLNSLSTQNFIKSVDPDLIISYGVHILDDEIISLAKHESWNIHGGLSPWYRGNITHFWPSYFLEPQMTGMTVHELTQDIDYGDIVHQTIADLIPGDSLHYLSCRAVISLGREIKELLTLFNKRKNIKKSSHKTTGRIWTGKDWKPEHLKLIYETFDDKIVDKYLSGFFEKREPKIFRQF